MIPKPGQAKLVFGNMGGGEAAVTINKQTIKLAAGARRAAIAEASDPRPAAGQIPLFGEGRGPPRPKRYDRGHRR